ncbi:hypothetical protein F5Y17DRAFT_419161 [Xylariaceae sp. FL0594]|nr:hypothetical protein F5Y17DRAFT_419161 [Xylariaceae sp. FL0594]
MAEQQQQQQQTPAAVDETPISPVSGAGRRKMSLEHHLKARPERSELVDKNILKQPTDDPAEQEKREEMAKHERADQLNEKIAHRPSPEQLVKEGVLHAAPWSSSSSSSSSS